jgi:hypothetical protein
MPQVHASLLIERVEIGTEGYPREERNLHVEVNGAHRAVCDLIAAAASLAQEEVER